MLCSEGSKSAASATESNLIGRTSELPGFCSKPPNHFHPEPSLFIAGSSSAGELSAGDRCEDDVSQEVQSQSASKAATGSGTRTSERCLWYVTYIYNVHSHSASGLAAESNLGPENSSKG